MTNINHLKLSARQEAGTDAYMLVELHGVDIGALLIREKLAAYLLAHVAINDKRQARDDCLEIIGSIPVGDAKPFLIVDNVNTGSAA